MMPPATWNARPSTQNSSKRTMSVQSMMSLLSSRTYSGRPRGKGKLCAGGRDYPTLLPTSALHRLDQVDRHDGLSGRFPCAGNHGGNSRDRVVETPFHDGAVRRKER